MAIQPDIVCIGEVLWDGLPEGLFLGGALFNVAYHLNVLGNAAEVATRVGDDRLGKEIVDRMARLRMSDRLVQTDHVRETGFVRVDLPDGVSPRYQILQPVAWDAIEQTETLLEAASGAKAVVFGTLAQRAEASRATIRAVASRCDHRVLDINLRPPFVDQGLVADSLTLATQVKLSDGELMELSSWWDGPTTVQEGLAWLAERFLIPSVCVTRGERGAGLFHKGRLYHRDGIPVEVVDTVGAGDAFLAGLLHAFLTGQEPETALAAANSLGAFVATQHGATPEHIK